MSTQYRTGPRQVVADPKWGDIVNLRVSRALYGDLFTATESDGRHRVLRSTVLPKPGRYRIWLDARYDGTVRLLLDFGGPQQPYGVIRVNLSTGTLEDVDGAVLGAGVETLNERGAQRWWVDMDLNQGRFDYSFGLWSAYSGASYRGTDACKVMIKDFAISGASEDRR